MKINKTPEAIWKEYQTGRQFNDKLELYDIVETNQNFYNGKQWEGVNAPNIEKPIINIIKPSVNYYTSMLVSDDISVNCELPEGMDKDVKDAMEYITTNEIEAVFERTKFRTHTRAFMKDTALNGDAYFHWWYNTEKDKGGKYIGAIDLEIIDSVNVMFGNPIEPVVENQPFILVVYKKLTEEVRDMVNDADKSSIVPDDEYGSVYTDNNASSNNQYTTLIIKLYKENDSVWFTKSTKNLIITKPIDLEIAIYPISKMNWVDNKESYHGTSPITEVIQNQIMINKFFMMLNEFVKKMSFPKILFDLTKLGAWSNKVEALGVNGNPNEVVAVSSPTASIDQQIIQFIQYLIQMTKETLGVYDGALGNIKPENTSAIVAVQQLASQPLELQRLAYYQVVEDSVRIIVELMRSFYGKREVPIKSTDEESSTMMFDYADVKFNDFGLNVEVGASSYWSEVTQIQTLDNMYRNGIIPDAITYLEQLPAGVVKNRSEIIDAIRRIQDGMMEQQQAQQGMTSQLSQPTNEMSGIPIRATQGVENV